MSKRKDKRVMTVEFDEKFLEEFKRIADKKGVNRAKIMRIAAEKFVEENK